MFKLFKVAVFVLAFFVYTSAAKGSFCKCRHVITGTPDNDPTERCCWNFWFGYYNNFTNFGCKSLHYSEKHHRCVCDDDTLYNNRVDWSGCCNVTSFQPEPDQGYDCVLNAD